MGTGGTRCLRREGIQRPTMTTLLAYVIGYLQEEQDRCREAEAHTGEHYEDTLDVKQMVNDAMNAYAGGAR